MKRKFKFQLNQTVKIITSGETGIIVGRAEFATSDNTYNIRYKCADGRAIESWWTESALKLVVQKTGKNK